MHFNPRIVLVPAFAVLLAACAGKQPAPPPPYDPAAAAEQQAASFIEAGKDAAKNMKAAKKLAITSCNVMFAQTSSATASTAGGLFSEAGGNRRADAKVSIYYSLVGLTEADMQRMTDAICADASAKLAAAGYDLVAEEELVANEAMMELAKAGRASPFEYKGGAGGGDSRYLVFAPGGATIFDERYIGTMSGLGQAFKQAKGTSAGQYELRVMDELGADAVNINILVDFAELQSSGSGSAGLASRNTAKVEGEVGLSVTGQLRIKIADGMKCWSRFGKRECSSDARKWPTYHTKRPIFTGEEFYESVENTTTAGDVAGAALTKGLSMLMGGTSVDITRYDVTVKPDTFEKVSRKPVDGFIDMSIAMTKASGKK